MISTAGHVKKYNPFCVTLFEEMHTRGTKEATLSEFMKKIEEEAATYEDLDKALTFKGDMLEILSEIFFELNKTNPALGLKDYKAISIENDYGVDATGTNSNNIPCAVQVKYRHNPKDSVYYKEIARTYASGRLQLKLALDTDNCIYVFTTAYDVNDKCKNVFGKMVRVINRETIETNINNNCIFWEEAFKGVLDVLFQPEAPAEPEPEPTKPAKPKVYMKLI